MKKENVKSMLHFILCIVVVAAVNAAVSTFF
jgi:hypothetical protein